MCTHVHAHAGGRPLGKQPVVVLTDMFCVHASEETREPSSTSAEVVLKARLIVQYYLGGTLVALEISRLLTFLTAFHVIHLYQRG